MKINIAITGASGSIYARLLIERLLACGKEVELRIVLSRNGRDVMQFEEGSVWLDDLVLKEGERVKIVENNDFYCSLASGSGGDDAMVVVPCSAGMMSRIASGISDDLISRGADVMLKERKKLILVVRETPLNLIHLRNMVSIAEAGGVVLPASPSFYSKPSTIEQLCNTTIDAVMRQLMLPTTYSWGSL